MMKSMKIGALAVCLLLLVCLDCRENSASAAKERQVNLFVWSAYIPDQVLTEFQQQTGIKLRFDTYDSNEALLEKMQSGVADYDVIVPSDYMVRILNKQDLLEKFDK